MLAVSTNLMRSGARSSTCVSRVLRHENRKLVAESPGGALPRAGPRCHDAAMTPQPDLVPTAVQPGAGWLGAGIPVTIVGVMTLLTAGFETLTHPDGGGPGTTLAWLGWLAVLGGSCLLGVGAFHLAQHADRAAGYKVRSYAWPTLPPAVSPDDEV